MFGHLCTVKDSGFSESFMSDDGIDLIYDCRACAGMHAFPYLQAPPPLFFLAQQFSPFYQFLLEVWLKVGLLEID